MCCQDVKETKLVRAGVQWPAPIAIISQNPLGCSAFARCVASVTRTLDSHSCEIFGPYLIAAQRNTRTIEIVGVFVYDLLIG
jgi:hypothetical protein